MFYGRVIIFIYVHIGYQVSATWIAGLSTFKKSLNKFKILSTKVTSKSMYLDKKYLIRHILHDLTFIFIILKRRI